MLCYRRHGHNEGDEPSFTQPVMYELIDAKRSVRKLYTESLIGRGDISVEEAEEALRDYQGQLERVSPRPATLTPTPLSEQPVVEAETDPDTAVTVEALKAIGDSQVSLPQGFTPIPGCSPSWRSGPRW